VVGGARHWRAHRGARGAHQVARTPHLSIGTVRDHITMINVKLDARDRVDPVRMATESGRLWGHAA
jgi:DNA-binding NarL/FixJ family response regulator